MKEYAQAIEEIVSGRERERVRYGSGGYGYEYPAATMIAYVYEVDISIVLSDIKGAKEAIEVAQKAARKQAHRDDNEERRLANLARRHNDKDRSSD